MYEKEYMILAGIIFAIGMLLVWVNIMILINNIKGKRFSSMAPFLGGILVSLALFIYPGTRRFWFLGFFADLSFWAVIYALVDEFIIMPITIKMNPCQCKVMVLVDNTPYKDLGAEHGLSLYIEDCHGRDKILLDAGKSELFYENAMKLGVDLSKVKFAVLSHSHYDHSDGFDKFFDVNKRAKLFVRCEAGEIYYSNHDDGLKYIGPKKGMLEKYADRIRYVNEEATPVGSWSRILIPHSTEELSAIGKRARLFKKVNGELIPDDFSHEQTLIIYTKKGVVIFNSCSHGGAANIIKEVLEYTGASKIYAYIGGFHLFVSSDEEIMRFAESLKEAAVERIITGHCTGDHAFDILKRELGDKVEKMHSGMEISIC